MSTHPILLKQSALTNVKKISALYDELAAKCLMIIDFIDEKEFQVHHLSKINVSYLIISVPT